jgi:hypothetical protein
MTDQQRVVSAIRVAQLILARYIAPGPRDADKTIDELLAVLDRGASLKTSTALRSSSG